MPVLWAGGELADFPTLAGLTIETATTAFRRSTYSRGALHMPNGFSTVGPAKSPVFEGGAVTDAWISFRKLSNGYGGNAGIMKLAGLGRSGGNNGVGIGVHNQTGVLQLIKTTGATNTTVLATGSALSASTVYELALRIQSFGASGTATVYVNGVADITFTGDLTTGGITNLDQVFLWSVGDGFNLFATYYLSEFIVADQNILGWGLATLAPTAAGDVDDWAGAYTDVDEANDSDGDLISDDDGEDFTCALTNTPAGSFTCRAVKVTARASHDGSGLQSLALGVRSGGTTSVGSSQALTGSYTTYERLMSVNPVTSAMFTIAEADALQAALRSAA